MSKRAVLGFMFLASVACASEIPEGFRSLFNGRDLEGWSGEPGYWTVEEGAITGRTTPDKPLKSNSFLIWQGGEPADFELRAKVRWPLGASGRPSGNSGIQFRSVVYPEVHPWCVGGYQYDMTPGGGLDGSLFKERGRSGIGLLHKGQRVVMAPDGERWRVAQWPVPSPQPSAPMWSECVIECVGNRITLSTRGVRVTEVVVEHKPHRRLQGVLALQLHMGSPMEVQFKDLWLREKPVAAAIPPCEAIPAGAVNLGREDLLRRVRLAVSQKDRSALERLTTPLGARAHGSEASLPGGLVVAAPDSVQLVEATEVERSAWAQAMGEPTRNRDCRFAEKLVWKNADGSAGSLAVVSEGGQWRIACLPGGSGAALGR